MDSLEPAVRGQFAGAIAAVRANPSDADAVGALAMLYHTYEIHRLAERCYRRAVSLAPDDSRWRYHLGVVLRERGRPDAAVEQFDVLLSARPDDAPTLMQRAAAELDRNRPGDALADYQHVIRIRPDIPQAYCGAGRALLKLNRLDACVTQLQRAIAMAPRYGRARYLLARALRDLGRVNQAAEQFRLAEEQRDDEPPIDDPLARALDGLATGAIDALHRGIAALKTGDVSRALPLLEESLRLNPDLAETHASLGSALVMTGALDRAADHLRRALALQPGYAQAHYNLGLIAHRRGRFAESVEHFQAALTTQPNHFDAHLGLGMDLPRLAQPPGDTLLALGGAAHVSVIDRAAEHLRTAARLRPRDPRPYKRLATLLSERGDFDAAIGALRSAVEHIPDDVTLTNRLAWMLATCPNDSLRHPDEAVRLAESVCRTTRRRVARPLDTLAAAYAAAGRFDEAVAAADEAIRAARARHDDALADEISKRLVLYRAQKAYRGGARPPDAGDP